MNYPQALEWVHSLPRMAGAPGVENTRILLQKLGNPERKNESEIDYETDFTDVTLKTQDGRITSVKISMFPD